MFIEEIQERIKGVIKILELNMGERDRMQLYE